MITVFTILASQFYKYEGHFSIVYILTAILFNSKYS